MVVLGYWGPDEENPTALAAALRRLGEAPAGRARHEHGLELASDAPIVRHPDGSLGTLAGTTLSDFPLLDALATDGLVTLSRDEADGEYALAWYDAPAGRLILAHDPFGARRVFHARLGRSLWFADSLRALLAVPALWARRALDLTAIHSYLTFSFVAAPRTPIAGIAVVPPNRALIFATPLSAPEEHEVFAPPTAREERDEDGWRARLREECAGAMARRAADADEPAVHLSGGVDSGAVAAWLARAGPRPRLFHLDFGPPFNAERPHAEEIAAWLRLPLVGVPVAPRAWGAERHLRRIIWALGELFGDPVTYPLAVGYEAARAAGPGSVWNGEGGDQLFAGWPNRAMFAAEVYAGTSASAGDDRARRYLHTLHHFGGQEDLFYGPALREAARATDLAGLARPYLDEPRLTGLFDRLRWANYWLKGSQNILPRAAALARNAGLTMCAPLFDRRLARFALTIPPDLLMRGTEEKWLLKRLLDADGLLPPGILARPKRGMGVPATAWCLGPWRRACRAIIRRLARRELFRPEALDLLLRGEDQPGDLRRGRRTGEKIWQLATLEIWLELFYDAFTASSP